MSDPRYVPARAVMDGVDLFDAAFFGYNPARGGAASIRSSGSSSSAAGKRSSTRATTRTVTTAPSACTAGSTANGYLFNVLSQPGFALSVSGLQALIGADEDFLATRVSYKLNLRGPSVDGADRVLDVARRGPSRLPEPVEHECDMALAGGVSVGVPVVSGYLHQEGGILSPDGHCRAFDADAQARSPGHGVGVVVLKRLADAIADGDTIHAVIRGTAINNDGSAKVGYTAPSVDGQAEVIALAQASAGVEPASVSYVEAHGTGTSLGDPIELAALTEAFGGDAAGGICAIGSVKTNIGHLDAAAGVAGLIKTVLALEHGEIPPSLHFESPNPKIDFGATPFFVNAALTPWAKTAGGPRRAGVSSFGIGGTNAHVVLEEAPAAGSVRSVAAVAAPGALREDAQRARGVDGAARRLSAEPPDGARLRTSPTRSTSAGASSRTGAWSSRATRPTRCRRSRSRTSSARSRAWRSPASVRASSCSAARARSTRAWRASCTRPSRRSAPTSIDAARLLRPHLGWDLRDVLTGAATPDVAARLKETSVTQPALFVVEYALAQLWMRGASGRRR